MIVKPKFRGFICTTAHPEGCAQHVQEQINYVKKQERISGPKKVLIIGASTGYGLASRIAATFGAGADTIGVFFERPASGKRTATAGWYNTVAFEKAAKEAGYYAKSINGDAFSHEIKQQTIDLIKADLGQVDFVVYSLASPIRVHPETGEKFHSVIKPIGQPFTNKTVDFHNGTVSEVTIEPATEEEIRQTIAVMGGEDWQMWIQALQNAGVLAPGATTVAYSYIGPEITHAVYREGTIGKAKDHLEATAKIIHNDLQANDGRAFVSINKALVTQSSSAIPVVPLYMSLLFEVMKKKGLHEGCIEQMYRLLRDRLYADTTKVDTEGRIRIDDWEMREDVQQEVMDLWHQANTDNLKDISDIEGYRKDFFRLFGFEFANIDYEKDVETEISIPSIQ
ncbi:enoyl-ACP reductase FabV [Thermoflavimicrobium daqui]|uniref:Trans-2-enoyl-CoA reductase [NADH] n=1 Tax=Thermoflavimicrobium daqui TaxID=2137476 RepID=A0A364K5M9_9BACL|nr:enoyl-ACP reductase FabV [Thermoflavimicrobium daqui]RAL25615.1 bifunctional NADH-specific enoyl-ACP reductase/trans-2-enoyl-CoA reductase [Thermoflavimicrobium daqui]